MSQTDMLLELSVLSYHRLSPRQVALKRFDGKGGSLGRAEHADWHLPDPERVVSGIHGQISCNREGFWITDNSTNGLFVNRSVAPLGNGNKHLLADGDLLCLGDYEINVAFVPQASQSSQSAQPTQSAPSAQSESAAVAGAGAETVGLGLAVSDFNFAEIPAAAKPASGPGLAAVTSMPAVAGVAGRHSDVLASNDMLSESFAPPQNLIPDDWQPQWQQPALPDEPIKLANTEPQQSVAANVPDSPPNAEQCLQAFLQALNVPAPAMQQLQNPAWWQQLGEALHASLHGIIEVMRSRSELKSSLRVNQTTFQQRENNPLKFSATVSDAFHNLFNHNAGSFMAPRQAISAAFTDISQHEAAIVAGAAGAMQGLLTQLTPDLITQRDFGASFIDKVNPAQRYNRYWNLYQALHQELLAEVSRTAKGGVNDDFIRAYEDYLANTAKNNRN